MRINLVKIGNSQGIRIPKAMIEACGFGSTVDLSVSDGALIIRADTLPRAGWAKAIAASPPDDFYSEWVSVDLVANDDWTWPGDSARPGDSAWPEDSAWQKRPKSSRQKGNPLRGSTSGS